MLTWLVSYPKSGNTWVRVFLACYDRGELPDWSELDSWHAASSDSFYESVGVEATDLLPAEIENRRPAVFRDLAAVASRGLTIKVHDGWRRTPSGPYLFPPDAIPMAVYIVRNPFDVAVSWAHHAGISVEAAVAFLGDHGARIGGQLNRAGRHLEQIIGSWSDHVTGWLDQDALPMHLVRYEDLVASPSVTFEAVVRATGREFSPDRLAAAISASRFDALRQREAADGFAERPLGVDRFFRQGTVGSWKRELAAAQVSRIIQDHGPVLRRLGYSTSDGALAI
jgi:aryl sulfotransferase